MHYWKSLGSVAYDRLTSYDGLMQNTLPFEWLHAGSGRTADSIITNPRDDTFHGAHGDSIIFTLPDTVSTTDWYVLIKVGAFMTEGETEPAYNWLLDELSLLDMAEAKPTSIDQVKTGANNFSVYPNPSPGIFNIKSEDGSSATFNVYDLLGNIVSQGHIENSLNVDLSKMNKGLYYISI